MNLEVNWDIKNLKNNSVYEWIIFKIKEKKYVIILSKQI